MIIAIVFVLFIVMYLFFASLFTTGDHLKYAIQVSKFYGYRIFLTAFIYSYYIDQKFVSFSSILPMKSDFETVSVIDMVCHQVLEGYENTRVVKYDNNKINFKSTKQQIDIVFDSLGIMNSGWDYNIILHPRTIHLINKALRKSLT